VLNDYSYHDVPQHAHDSRWLHRPRMDWDAAERASAGVGPAGQVLAGTRRILARRAQVAALHGGLPVEVLDPGPGGVFAFARRAPTGSVVCLFNFADHWQAVPAAWLHQVGVRGYFDQLSEVRVETGDGAVHLSPYGQLWLD
jgi:amylosucrase